MNTKLLVVSLLLIALSLNSGGHAVAQHTVPDGFQSLFNGQNLEGWDINPDKGAWYVKQGVIGCTGNPRTPYLILTEKEYENFELYVDFKLSKGCNSGIFLHQTERSWGRESRNGMEIQVLDHAGKPVNKSSCGAIYEQVPALSNPVKPAGHWNRYYMIMDWPYLKVWLNDQLVQDLNLENYPELKYRLRNGYIGLQNHDHPVEYKNIYIKELPGNEKWTQLFNGKDLAGWTAAGDADWSVENGVLKATGGSGYLISNDAYENYECQLFAAKYKNGGNSGVFYSWQNDQDRGYKAEFKDWGSNNKKEYQFLLTQLINNGNQSLVRENGEDILVNKNQTSPRKGKIVLYHAANDGDIRFARIRIKEIAPSK